MPQITLVTAVTPSHLPRLRWTVGSWTIKKQFRRAPLIVFYHDMEAGELAWIGDLWKAPVKLVPWPMPQAENNRERMISAFVLGAAEHVETSHCIKVDADCYCTNAKTVFMPEDFEVDLCSHSWGYTKPAWFITALEKWSAGEEYERGGDMGSKGHKRIQSICCLHKTSFLKAAAELAGGRLPVPSHDTYLWWLAENVAEFSWSRKNLKKFGVGHASRWKGCRENVCASDGIWNADGYKLLRRYVQLEITTACNLACPNCDRNCGTAPSGEMMTLAQVRKFVDESLLAHQRGHQWHRIDVLGGEPTLHPEIIPILNELNRYKTHAGATVRLTTNGTGKKVLGVLKTIPPWVKVRNSSAEKVNPEFEAVNAAPCDAGHATAQACSIPWRCGLALTRYGYFLCGAGASVARVFGMDIGLKSLDDLADMRLMKFQRDTLCRLCGHSRSSVKLTTKPEASPTWAKAFAAYKVEKPTLGEY